MCSDRKCNEASRDKCDHVTGNCESGCRPGWKDTDCTEECIPGVECGADCVGNCSARMCKGKLGTCPGDTGWCESVFQPGWRGEDCAQVCSPGTFGADCDNYCHCEGEACDYVSGVCPGGVCLPGWTTETFDTVCELGRYGANCSHNCPMGNCKGDNSSCDHVTGECIGGCGAGWNGLDLPRKCRCLIPPHAQGTAFSYNNWYNWCSCGCTPRVPCKTREKDEVRDSQGPVDKNITQASDNTSVSKVAHDDGCSIGNNYVVLDVATKADSEY